MDGKSQGVNPTPVLSPVVSEKKGNRPPEQDSNADGEREKVRFPLGEFGGGQARGEIRAIKTVSKDAVPSSFPQKIETLEALKIRLILSESEESEITTYLPWPATGPGEEFRQLAALAEVSPDNPEELIGARILLQLNDDQYVPLLPEGHTQGTEYAVYGAWAGLVPSISIALFSFFGLGTLVESFFFFVLWGIGTFVVLPVSVYLDAWELRGKTTFTGNPLFWAVISAFPPFYVITAPYYLLFVRQNALPLVTTSEGEQTESAE